MTAAALQAAIAGTLVFAVLAGWLAHALWHGLGQRAERRRVRLAAEAQAMEIGRLQARLARAEARALAAEAALAAAGLDVPGMAAVGAAAGAAEGHDNTEING